MPTIDWTTEEAEDRLKQLYKNYGVDNGLTFEEFKKWINYGKISK